MTPAEINRCNREFWDEQSVKDLQRWKRQAGSRRGGLSGGLRRGTVNTVRDARIRAAYAAGVMPKLIAADCAIFPGAAQTAEAFQRRVKLVWRVLAAS